MPGRAPLSRHNADFTVPIKDDFQNTAPACPAMDAAVYQELIRIVNPLVS